MFTLQNRQMTSFLAELDWPALLRHAGGRMSARAIRPMRRLARPSGVPRVRELALTMPLPPRDVQARGDELYRGLWRLAGQEVCAGGQVIFDRLDAPASWQRELHRFDWVFALLAPGRCLWAMMAGTLALDWLERARRKALPALALRPDVAARRLVNLTAAAPLLQWQEEATFGNRFMTGLNALARQLLRAPIAGLEAAARLEVVMARLWTALALGWPERQRQHLLHQLEEELLRQFLPDGGHVSRSPAILLDILCTLLPLRTALEEAAMEVPAGFVQTVEKALPMLRMFRHADHGLALFQGVRRRQAGLLDEVLQQDPVAGAPLDHAPHSGYARLARGASVLIADVGVPPLPQHHAVGALSALALEFSSDGARIFTSCGAPLRAQPELDMAARMTAAHCAPLLNDEDAGMLMDNVVAHLLADAPLAAGPKVSAVVRDAAQGITLEAAHDAWRGRHGFVTRRRLFLSADGRELCGEDAFEPADDAPVRTGVPFTIRFHLHPGASPAMARDGRSVLVVLPNRSAWTFTAAGAEMSVEESLFMSGEHGPRRSMQIVLRGACSRQGAQVRWRLCRSDVKTGRRTKGERNHGQMLADATPALPL